MGSLVEKAVELAVQALRDRDRQLATQVIDDDDLVDRLEVDLEERCIRLIALQQPLAGDLRTIGTVLKVITDLERVGDYATNIAEVAVRLAREPLFKPLIDIPRLAEMAQRMLRQSLDAFVHRDVELAEAVCRADDPVDDLFAALYDELMQYVAKGADMVRVTQAINLIFAARYLERIADHATNIGERVIYMVTGKRVAHQLRGRILGSSASAAAPSP
ncbi:MAG: phosphate signaling complex protein PhoU [Limnochordaceae bacterium]|nr:phosphate signaling complex protein PhoU [Limnochordaceae bacterium]